MIFRPKKETLPVIEEKQEVEGMQAYVVSWNALEGRWKDSPTLVSCKRVAKAFVDRDDAEYFVKSLEEAMALLQLSYYADIKLEVQA